MKNRPNFIPKSLMQPDRYDRIFNNWNAIYTTKAGVEYHIEIDADFWNNGHGRHLNILKQNPTCRSTKRAGIPSIKQAVTILESIM